jgi:transposase
VRLTLVGSYQDTGEVSRMTNDDVIHGFRLQLFDLAARTTVSNACRVFGVHRSTYYRWAAQVDRHGLVILKPRERRAPRMPNQTPQIIEERILAFSIGHPGLGPDRISCELRRECWGGLRVSPNGVWRVLRRHGLNHRRSRYALVAGTVRSSLRSSPLGRSPPAPHRSYRRSCAQRRAAPRPAEPLRRLPTSVRRRSRACRRP